VWRFALMVAVLGCGNGTPIGGYPTDAAPGGGPDAGDTRVGCDPPDTPFACPEFAGSWGGRGYEEGQFIEPSSVELDSNGVVIVAGHENRIQRFTMDGELIDIFGTAGQGDGQFNHPHGLAVDRRRGDLVYVGDQENSRLQVFTSDGQFIRQWGDEKFQHIHDVGIDPSTGDVFVGDYELHTVRKFSPTGVLLDTYGGPGVAPGKFNGVWGISTDSQGYVYVADTFGRRVQKLDRNGALVAVWNDYGGEDFVKPTGVFVDHTDTVYICDSLAQRVVLFDGDGDLLQVWNLEAIYGERSEPEDIVISPDGKHIYLGEVWGHRVLHLRRP
jgi:sugar lactone lactonase YvrE